MGKGLKFAVVSVIFLFPFTSPHSALSWESLTYQEAVRMCDMGFSRACDVMYAYMAEIAGSGRSDGSPADRWVSPEELQQGGLRGVRPGPLSTYDFIR
jgi:hypothetical protein